MAADPLAGYTPNDPLAGYTPSSPPGGVSQYQSDLDAAAKTSWLGWAAQKLNASSDVMAHGATFGLGSLLDKAFGPQAQADAAKNYENLGAAALPVAVAGGLATGQSELAGAKAAGGAIAPYLAKLPLTGQGKWLGGVLGSGVAGAPAGAVTAYANQPGWTPDWGNIGEGALVSGGLSAAGAVPGGVVGRGGTLPAGVPLPQLAAVKDAAASDMGDVLYDNADLRQRTTQAVSDIMAAPNRVAEQGGGALGALSKFSTKILGNGARSAEDVNDLVKSLKQTSTGDKVPVAGQIAQDHFNDLLNTVQPITTPSSIPLAPNAGRTAVNNFNQAFGPWADLNRVEGPGGWMEKAAVSGGPDVGSQAKSYLLSDEGQRLAPPGTPQYDLYNQLAATAKPVQAPGVAPNAWELRHALQEALEPAIMGMAVGGGGEAVHGGDWGHILGATAAGALTGYGLHKVVPLMQSIGQQGRQQAALEAARVGTSLGQNVTPIAPMAPVRDAIRRLIYAGTPAVGAYGSPF